MLSEIRVKNFAIIEHLKVEFGKGLNCLTGETGAGKSILVDALNLLLGSRASPEMIRTGEEEASVEAFFDLSDSRDLEFLRRMGVDPSEGLLAKRLITRSGKSRAYLNGNSVTLHMLEEIMENLIHIYGQHEHQHFLDPLRHIDILDQAGKLLPWRESFEETYRQWFRCRAELQACSAKKKERSERIELLTYQWKEISQAQLRPPKPNEPDEEAQLSAERMRLLNAEKLHTIAQQGFDTLYGERESVVGGLKATLQRLREGAKLDPSLKPLAETMESALFQAEDVASALRAYMDKGFFDPQRLDEIETRLNEIQKLKRKYGSTIAEILAYQEKISQEKKTLETLDDRIGELEKEYQSVKEKMICAARELSQKRKTLASGLAQKVEQELSTLGMKKARFAVEIKEMAPGKEGKEEEDLPAISEKGMDQVQFLLSPNPGEELKPLARIASGGELSRIMLALKSIFSEETGVRTLIFDEVDAGIGGGIAEVVGRKLKEISIQHQVFCITHLAPIASLADFHFSVSKKTHGGRTYVEIKALEGEERVEEIARMLGGLRITSKTLEHAREMLRQAEKGWRVPKGKA
jgi:DNA repair protein RecN (Recombination protein N)